MLWDNLIPRMQAKGLTVHDVRTVLPRNGRWMGRPVSAIKGISYHWDAEPRAHAYDSLAKIIAQANYHINKDWGDGSHGDGLMYAFQVDNIGDLYVTRDLEDVLWSVGSLNYSYIAGCWHGLDQPPTREQIESMQKISDVLSWETPEITAGRSDIRGHQEVPGNSTACNGTFLPPTQWYRDEENTHPERFVYDWPDVPTPPVTPVPPADSRPVWEKNDFAFTTDPKVRTMYINQDTTLFDITTGAATATVYRKGDKIENLVRETSVGSQIYWRTAYSVGHGFWTGFKREHLSETNPNIPPVVTPPADPPVTPVPPVVTPGRDDEQDARLTALESFRKLISEFLAKLAELLSPFKK